MSDKIVRATRAALVQAQAQVFLDQGVITPAHPVLPPAPQPSSQVSIEWVNAYSDQASQAQSDKTGVLIFCSSRRPGGGWLNGAKAQEEDVSLASTWAVQAAASDGSFYQDSDGVGNNMALMADGLWLFDPNGHPPTPSAYSRGLCGGRRPQPQCRAGRKTERQRTDHHAVRPLARRL